MVKRNDDFMQSILEAFAQGNISPESRFFESGSHYGHTIEVLSDCEEKLLWSLNEHDKKVFKEFCEAQTEINLLSGIDKFIYGYRLGVLMTMEVFNGKNDLVIAADKRKDG